MRRRWCGVEGWVSSGTGDPRGGRKRGGGVFGGTGRSELRVAGCVLGYPGVVTWVNGGGPGGGCRGVGGGGGGREGGGTFALKCGHR